MERVASNFDFKQHCLPKRDFPDEESHEASLVEIAAKSNSAQMGYFDSTNLGGKFFFGNHLSTEELFVRYREAAEATERSHFQIMWLLAMGKTVKEVSEVTGYTKIWIYQIINSIVGKIQEKWLLF